MKPTIGIGWHIQRPLVAINKNAIFRHDHGAMAVPLFACCIFVRTQLQKGDQEEHDPSLPKGPVTVGRICDNPSIGQPKSKPRHRPGFLYMVNTPMHFRKNAGFARVVHLPVVCGVVVDFHKGLGRAAGIRTGTHFHFGTCGTGTVKGPTPMPAGVLVRHMRLPGAITYLYIITRAEGFLYKAR